MHQTARKRRNRGHTLQCRSSTEGSGRTKQKKGQKATRAALRPTPPLPHPPLSGGQGAGAL